MEMSHLNPFGIGGFGITASLAIRPDGAVLENKGVSPDVQVELSVNDLQYDDVPDGYHSPQRGSALR
jgi:C-terminal processing protease CtpA/Prc